MAIRGAKLTFGGGKKKLGVQKKWRLFFFFGDSKIFVLCRGAI